MKPIDALRAAGQSVWLDYIRRSLLTSGKLRQLVDESGVTGVTANPTIFEKAIVGSADYDPAIREEVERTPALPLPSLYEHLAVADVRAAADVLRPVYDRTQGAEGFVSLEVAPGLAHDTGGTVAEARRLWAEVGRPNLLVKVPATPEGVPAIAQLIGEGINVNVTLAFSESQYESVSSAYLRGLERTPDPARVASVASFFVSRVDTKVDPALDALASPPAAALRGTVAIANCRRLYARYLERFHGEPFARWRTRGARPQRLLWASTSTKDPRYRDTLYVEELVGAETITTIPPATFEAFQDHGVVRGPTVTENVEAADRTLRQLASLGIDLEAISRSLLDEGVAAFSQSFGALLEALEAKRSLLFSREIAELPWSLGPVAGAVTARLDDWQRNDAGHRFWRKDPTFWPQAPPSDVANRMGWIALPEGMHDRLAELTAFADEVSRAGFRHAVVLGMGGSSLAPDVFARTFEPRPGYPELLVLDSTHPAAVAALAQRIDLARTLFLVSSKSGTTTEPLSFFHYFFDRVAGLSDTPGRQFIAITDPGTPLEQLAAERRFRRVFRAPPDVGGRYSALSVFGLVPAALLGIDLGKLLDRAFRQAEAGAFCVPATENPGFRLGAALGELALAGRDKVTFLTESPFDAFPDWAEQLIAESTGKQGRGIVPVVDEPPGPIEVYGPDRAFVSLEQEGRAPRIPPRAAELAKAGHPVLRFPLEVPEDIGGEFFRWESAIAVAGPVLGIDPFDQPDVELAKQLAREAMAAAPGTSRPPEGTSVSVADAPGLRQAVDAFVRAAGPRDYLAIQAYLAPSVAMTSALARMRSTLLTRYRHATTFGYGPRFLHSTGQLHKGGPSTGRFLQLTDDFAEDLAVPETDYTFGRLLRAQALGDLLALRQRGRPVLRVELGRDPMAGLGVLARSLDA